MRYGFIITGGSIHAIVQLAAEAEEAGWDGVFYWDGIHVEGMGEVHDPWVVLAAIASRTSRVRIGAILTPPSRRRPWKLARETVSVDHLSRGRLVLPVGLGAVDTFGPVGEVTDRKVRAQLLDESLEILTGLWSGQPFAFDGEHYQVGEMTFLPPPVQSPRIPIWVVGAWPSEKSMRRVLRYDGLLPAKMDGEVTPNDIRAMADYIAEHRADTIAFDIVWDSGRTPGDNPDEAASLVAPYAEAGVTWWIEAMWSPPNAIDDLRLRIQQGPPRIA